MPGQDSFRCLKFGVFEADLETGELRKHGLRVRLPGQSFQVLTLLLKTPGEIVSREHLRLRVWKGEAFVEFDGAINKAISLIRRSLGDTSDSPRFVETIAGRGYHFIAPVTDVGVLQEKRQLPHESVNGDLAFMQDHFPKLRSTSHRRVKR